MATPDKTVSSKDNQQLVSMMGALNLDSNSIGDHGAPSPFDRLPIELVHMIFFQLMDVGSFRARGVCRLFKNAFNTVIGMRLNSFARYSPPGGLNFKSIIGSVRQGLVPRTLPPTEMHLDSDLQMRALHTLNNFLSLKCGISTANLGIIATMGSLEFIQNVYSTNLITIWSKIHPQLNFGETEVPKTAEEIENWLKDPSNASKLLAIDSLDLSALPIQILPTCIFAKLKNLNSLNLKDTQVFEVESVCNTLTKLMELDVSGTKIKEIPANISKLQQLMVLRASNTVISEVPAAILSLKNLGTLEVNDCLKLAKVPVGIKQMPNLILFLYENTPLSHAARRVYGGCRPKDVSGGQNNYLF